MKYAVWLCPLGIGVLLVETLSGDATVPTIVATALIVYGGLASYRMGTLWESRWASLASERSARLRGTNADPADSHST